MAYDLIEPMHAKAIKPSAKKSLVLAKMLKNKIKIFWYNGRQDLCAYKI